MLAISVPLASSAGKLKHARLGGHASPKQTWISPGLLRGAKRHPNQYVRVIIQSTSGRISPALSAFTRVTQYVDDEDGLNRRLSLIDGVSATVRAGQLSKLTKLPGLIVTPDVQVRVSGFTSGQLWPYETGLSRAWSGPNAPKAGTVPTIAIVDSGIEPDRTKDFGNRVLASVKFSTLPDDSPGDGRGQRAAAEVLDAL